MLAARSWIIVLLLALLMPACGTRTLRIPVPDGTPLKLVTWHYNPSNGFTEPNEVLLRSSAPEYKRLQEWIAQNQAGWEPSLAPPPSTGIFVHSSDLHMQFDGKIASVFTETGH